MQLFFANKEKIMGRSLRLALVASFTATFALMGSIAAAQDAPAGAVSKPACKKPEFPGKLASETQKRAFNKDIEGFADCIKKYVAEQQKIADDHIKAANQAAADYNNAVKELQSEINEAKE